MRNCGPTTGQKYTDIDQAKAACDAAGDACKGVRADARHCNGHGCHLCKDPSLTPSKLTYARGGSCIYLKATMQGPWTNGYVMCAKIAGCESTTYQAKTLEECKSLCIWDTSCMSIDWNPNFCIIKTEGMTKAKASGAWYNGHE